MKLTQTRAHTKTVEKNKTEGKNEKESAEAAQEFYEKFKSKYERFWPYLDLLSNSGYPLTSLFKTLNLTWIEYVVSQTVESSEPWVLNLRYDKFGRNILHYGAIHGSDQLITMGMNHGNTYIIQFQKMNDLRKVKIYFICFLWFEFIFWFVKKTVCENLNKKKHKYWFAKFRHKKTLQKKKFEICKEKILGSFIV